MPRVRAPPAASAAQPSPFKAPVKIPLNDDRREKAERLHSRQVLNDARIDSLKAAATPTRKRRSLNPDAPGTPQDGVDGVFIGGAASTPMKRVPILANFEEWMKMATDNKINATNSWNFALIDYFHDMSLLKEGDGVNFQKASCTLDGCVKIYTSRVDSVATETGKLLSGLADSGNKKSRGDEEGAEGDEDDEGEEGEDGVKRRKKKTTRSAEATLATSFAQLQLKKMEMEFAVDPLFKKASADFDEGGAKGLLLNHLCIDNTGRIVFDSSDDAQQELLEDSRRDNTVQDDREDDITEKTTSERLETQIESTPVDIAGLGARFFPNLALLENQSICPSMQTFELGAGSATLDLPFLKAAEDWKKEQETKSASANDLDDARSGIVLDDDNALGFDDDLGGFDLPANTGFGEGGEVWAREANIVSQPRPHVLGPDGDGEGGEDGEVGAFESSGASYGVTLVHRPADEQANILSYFDSALAKNWAGPEHWKIKRVKDAAKPSGTPPTRRKEKEPFEIDFLAPMSQALADLLYTPALNNSAISLPKTQRRSKTRNLLPDDKHFNSRSLLTLFLKPKARLGARRAGHSTHTVSAQPPAGDIDEAYWATHAANVPEPLPEDVLPGTYDADFFQDDGLPMGAGGADDDDDFADVHETLAPPLADAATPTDGAAFGAQLVAQSRRARPEYVQYARVAKKVDVRRLKEEMWRGLGMSEAEEVEKTQDASRLALAAPKQSDGSLRFTDVVNNLQKVYPKQQMTEISTSFCFIALLHLANEKGLVISNQEDFQELTIRRDHSAEVVVGGD